MTRPTTRRLLLVAAIAACSCRDEAVVGTVCPDTVDDSAGPATRSSEPPLAGAAWVAASFDKREVEIPMRDGVKLFTAIYSPKQPGPHPILMMRTPYSIGPYGGDAFPERLGPSEELMAGGYIFVYQDVRGRFMSGGEFVNMTPHRREKASSADVDESSDTYDTIEWLLTHVDGHNARVGQWGISYPGFYAAAGMIDAHPALVAVSPQAPIADWFFDDFHHHGAFLLPHLFNFIASFGRRRDGPTTEWPPRFEHGTPDGFQFFLDIGPLRNANDRYFHHEIPFWDEVAAHPNYDEFWQRRNLLPHLDEVAPAVMTVGGLFDAEDLYGPLHIYRAIEAGDSDEFNILVMGPWSHGGWARTSGDRLGEVHFGAETAVFYRQEIEKRFFDHFLKGEGEHGLPEAYVFETGRNRWRRFDTWPPPTVPATLHLAAQGRLDAAPPTPRVAADRFVSDPAHPVPYSQDIDKGMTKAYMTDDQRFAARRADVLTYGSDPLTEALTIAGPITASLWVSTSEADADWIVKIIDVFPGDAADPEGMSPGKHMGGYQMMVRSEVLRGRFRDGYEHPRRFVAGRPTRVEIPLQDVLHTFEAGHRLMIQIQSSWFPLVDRNPQSWVANIFEANADDFTRAEHRVYRERAHASALHFGKLP